MSRVIAAVEAASRAARDGIPNPVRIQPVLGVPMQPIPRSTGKRTRTESVSSSDDDDDDVSRDEDNDRHFIEKLLNLEEKKLHLMLERYPGPVRAPEPVSSNQHFLNSLVKPMDMLSLTEQLEVKAQILAVVANAVRAHEAQDDTSSSR